MLGAPAETLHPTFSGLFAGDSPRDVFELLDAFAADARCESVGVGLGAIAEADLRDVLPGMAVPG